MLKLVKSIKFWATVFALLLLIPLIIIQAFNVPLWKDTLHANIWPYVVEFIAIVFIYVVKLVIYFANITRELNKSLKWMRQQNDTRLEKQVKSRAVVGYIVSAVICTVVGLSIVGFIVSFFFISGSEPYKWAAWWLKTLFVLESFIYLWVILGLILPKRTS
ncbi:MAG: hypothetical protein ACMUIU_15175 [bacterium]